MAHTRTFCQAMLSLVAGACTGGDGGSDTAAVPLPAGVHLGPRTTCAAPVSDRLSALTEQREAWGLDVALGPHPSGNIVNFNGNVVLEDLDGDGDLDIAFSNDKGPPRVFANDGQGGFTEQPADPYDFQRNHGTAPATHAVADVDGDGHLDLLQAGQGHLFWSRALGGLRYSEPELLWAQAEGRTHIGTLAMGDMDADGDLDILLPGLEDMTAGGDASHGPTGSPDILLRNDGDGVVTEVGILTPGASGHGGVNITAVFTDREGDGDADLLVLPDLGQVLGDVPPGAFWRNDGAAGAHPFGGDDAARTGFDLRMSAMGLSNGDWNDDGLLDYCISDVGPSRCMVSQPDGGWADAGRAMGAVSVSADDPGGWSHWSIDVEDLDNDGWPELVAAGGAPTGGASSLGTHPDALMRGSEGIDGLPAFEDMSAEIAFDSRADHYGSAVGDMDGDGALDVLLVAAPDEVRVWSAGCTAEAWLGVRLVGPPGNPTGVGARVRVLAGDRAWTREAMHLRAMGQGPTQVHVGLGDHDAVDAIEVTWPDGWTVDIPSVDARRVVTVRHPDAAG